MSAHFYSWLYHSTLSKSRCIDYNVSQQDFTQYRTETFQHHEMNMPWPDAIERRSLPITNASMQRSRATEGDSVDSWKSWWWVVHGRVRCNFQYSVPGSLEAQGEPQFRGFTVHCRRKLSSVAPPSAEVSHGEYHLFETPVTVNTGSYSVSKSISDGWINLVTRFIR